MLAKLKLVVVKISIHINIKAKTITKGSERAYYLKFPNVQVFALVQLFLNGKVDSL